jgi:arsenate reductase (glutaredoxin)
MTDVFRHNPRCSKSRAALELVREAGVELPVREYLRDPLSVDELRRIVTMLGVRPIDIVRRGESEYKTLGLSDATPATMCSAPWPSIQSSSSARSSSAAAVPSWGARRKR